MTPEDPWWVRLGNTAWFVLWSTIIIGTWVGSSALVWWTVLSIG